MDLVSALGTGFAVALQPVNLLYCFAGVLVGTLVGVLPGVGPVAGMSLLLPLSYKAPPEAAIILLAGIYYGSMYGGSTTSILINVPGEAASIVTALDGHRMAQQGRAGPALGMAAIASFIAGTLALVGLTLLAPALARIAVTFGSAEYFSLMLLGMTVLAYLSQGLISKAILMAAFGIVLGLVGLDPMSALPRLTFDRLELVDGVGIVPIVVGLFGFAEILAAIEQRITPTVVTTHLSGLMPNRDDWRRSGWPIARGSVLGFILGILPGGGAVIASFLAYGIEKRISKTPERFGMGAIEGVAAPEAANNAAAGGAFIPLLTLGIPPNVIMAILLSAFIVQGVQPGPLLMVQRPDLFWGVVCSMYIGNIMLLILNLPLVGLWVKLLRVPDVVLYPLIMLFCVIGVYATSGSIFDIYLMIGFGIFAHVLRSFGYEPAPLVLGYVLGPLLEINLRKALIISDGDWTFLVTRPISATFLALVVAVLLSALVPHWKAHRRALPTE
ncbi:MAG: tripartite tricarboxylate transporter permease, partial [Pseudomonadota bacterium]